ncbi:hypothetical protein [Pseudactinotalea terrae]|uniref:hypothetical protein n=1 Tax=Pseudactinotalea terrae TaxID=1743262 RepID=UPI0012E1E938|nr:hypothetical protein [Pseudactinotalea terrae]
MDTPRSLTQTELDAIAAAQAFLEAAPSGAIVTDNGEGWPWVKNVIGTWKRDGVARPLNAAEVVQWHTEALLDPDDDTDQVFAPVLMVPATTVPAA